MFDRIKDSIEKFSSKNVADREAVQELVKDIQRDLIQADVDVALVSDLTDEIKEEALDEEVPDGVTRKEHVLKIVYDKLEELLGEEAEIEEEPQNILLCGLYGAGKTTTAGKLADFYRKRGLKVGLIAADTDRPAAYEQLQQIAEDVDAEFYGDPDAEDPVEVVREGMEGVDADVKIVDSAGRDSLDEELSQELSDISEGFDPDEKYLVIPADIGQSAREQAETFDDSVGITGVIVTKMDSSAKGGGALVACANSEASVKFIGTGEKMGDLEVYDPVDFVSDMIGQPDLESLLEKIQELDTDPEEILEGEFTMRDFRGQIESVTDSGVMEEMMQQLPFGKDKIPGNIEDITEGKVQRYSFMMDSMTDEEMKDPSVINESRRGRIAKGSGTTKEEVSELVKHYQQTKNMVNQFDKGSMKRGNMKQMMNKLGF
ncbi:MAG: signal recognition particle receptor subunit alpha [Candidatus Nanosalina sp.]